MKKNSRLSKSRQFILLEMVFFLHTGIIGAVYTLYLLSLGLSLFEANAISAIFNIAAIVFEVPSGAMCDSIGKRKTSLFAGVTLFLAMLCFLSSVNILVTVMGQVFWGLSYALESGTIEAWFVNDGALKGNELDRVFAASSKIQSVIMIVGSFIGSWLADYSLKFIWLIPCISSVCFIIMVLKFVEDKKEIQPKSSILSLYKTSIKYIKIGGSLIVKNQRITYLYIFVTLMGFISSPLMIFWSVYLKQIDSELIGETVYSTMVIPNREILSIYKRTIQQWFEETIKQEKNPPLLQAILDEDPQAVQNEINRWLRKCISFYDTKENFYHGFLVGLLAGSEIYQVKSNRENGDGRTDITVCEYQTREVAVVIEVKIAETFRQLDAKCDEGLKQIRDMRYSEELIDDCYRKVIRYGVAFYQKACKVKMDECLISEE